MKKILVLPLLLCLIFCSFLSLDKNLDEFDPDRTADGSYDHRVVWGSYASSDKAALPQQEVLDSRAVLYSESGALLQLIHIILFAYAAIVVMRICLTNTSRRFIIRFIHDKDGLKLISFADYFKTRAYAEEI